MVSIHKDIQTATVSMVLDGTNATSSTVYRLSVDNLNTIVSNKGIPLPLQGYTFPIYNATDKKYEPLGIYADSELKNFYLNLTIGKVYYIVGSYITTTAVS